MKAILFALFLLLNTTIFAQSLEIKSPNELPKNDQRTKIFLGGTIDMGNSEDWQAKVSKELKNEMPVPPTIDAAALKAPLAKSFMEYPCLLCFL